jgi:hypothetical protein
MSPSPSCHGRTVVTDGRLRGLGRGRSRTPSGPERQRRRSSRNSTAASWRTITCSWSPASTTVEPRGGIARSPRTITFSSASRGSPSSRTACPTTASPSRTGNWITSAPSRLSSTGSTSGAGIAASSERTPSRRATGSIVAPCRTVENSTTKNVTLKIVRPPSMPSVTAKVANTTGTAPRSPAQPSTIFSPTLKPWPTVTSSVASGRAITAVTSAIAVPSSAIAPRSSGNTSSPRIRNSASWAIQARPSWKVTIVRRAGVVAVPSTSPAR